MHNKSQLQLWDWDISMLTWSRLVAASSIRAGRRVPIDLDKLSLFRQHVPTTHNLVTHTTLLGVAVTAWRGRMPLALQRSFKVYLPLREYPAFHCCAQSRACYKYNHGLTAQSLCTLSLAMDPKLNNCTYRLDRDKSCGGIRGEPKIDPLTSRTPQDQTSSGGVSRWLIVVVILELKLSRASPPWPKFRVFTSMTLFILRSLTASQFYLHTRSREKVP